MGKGQEIRRAWCYYGVGVAVGAPTVGVRVGVFVGVFVGVLVAVAGRGVFVGDREDVGVGVGGGACGSGPGGLLTRYCMISARVTPRRHDDVSVRPCSQQRCAKRAQSAGLADAPWPTG